MAYVGLIMCLPYLVGTEHTPVGAHYSGDMESRDSSITMALAGTYILHPDPVPASSLPKP